MAPLQNNLCHAAIGNYSRNIDGLSFSQKYKQLYINHVYNRGHLTIKNDFWTAICAVDAKVFKRFAGFNSYFKGANGEDQEFGIRLTKYGYRVWTVKNANGQHLNPYGVLNIIRNDFRKGLVAVKNSLDNKVPFSDNRHSKKQDIISVLFAVLTAIFLILIPISIFSISPFLSSFIIWLTYRIDLSRQFLKYGGKVFFIKSLMLMFTLDLVRCMCVIVAVVKYKILRISLEASEILKPVSA
jgi:cellulose synthase/poly-beta-1,6-N-acetylglucosamine synthase-like glycosyltransferase